MAEPEVNTNLKPEETPEEQPQTEETNFEEMTKAQIVKYLDSVGYDGAPYSEKNLKEDLLAMVNGEYVPPEPEKKPINVPTPKSPAEVSKEAHREEKTPHVNNYQNLTDAEAIATLPGLTTKINPAMLANMARTSQRMTVVIPPDQLNPRSRREVVIGINADKFRFERGRVYDNVPVQVAKMVYEKIGIRGNIAPEFRTDRDEVVDGIRTRDVFN